MGVGRKVSAIVKRGVLIPGTWVVCGETYGKIKTLFDTNKKTLKEVYPSQIAEIVGLEGIPKSSDYIIQVRDEETALSIVESRLKKKKINELNKSAVSIQKKPTNTVEKKNEPVVDEQLQGEINEVLIIVKVDVEGTLDAINKILSSFPKEEVRVKLIRGGIGNITESDIDLARSTKSIVIGMNCKAETLAKDLAKEFQIEIKTFNVIYHFIDFLKEKLLEIAPVTYSYTVLGTAKVETPFDISIEKKTVKIAGSIIQKGNATVSASYCNVLRWKKPIFENLTVTSLYRFKNKVNTIPEGQECGIYLSGYDDVQKGDVIEFIQKEKDQKNFEDLK
jgi:translation initiation factor IF-2